MLTLSRLKDILNEIEYKNWKFTILNVEGLWFLQLSFEGFDNDDGRWKEHKSRKWYISPHSTDSEIIQTVFLAIKTAEEHEMREAFKYKRVAVLGPHFDLNERASLDTREVMMTE